MRHHRLAIAAFLLPLTCAAAFAALPTFWQISTETEFLRGEFENLSIDSYGRLTLGPTTTPVHESTAPFLWTVIPSADGGFYAGTGNDGQVYKIDGAGKAELFFDAEELEVHALATAANGALYVATSPDGKIYRVEGAGKSSVFFDPADKYIWSLAVDRSGNVFAATDGKGAPFYQTKATHAMTLAFDRDGRLLAGTESPGRVFRIDASGKPFVLLDSSFNEIRSLRIDSRDGTMYAVAVSSRVAGTPTPPPSAPTDTPGPQPTVTVTAEVTA